MATLADSFLADFESDGDTEQDDSGDEDEYKELGIDPSAAKDDNVHSDLEDEDIKDLDELDDLDDDLEEDIVDTTSISAISDLLEDPKLEAHLEKLKVLMEKTENENVRNYRLRRGDEYDVIVASNLMAISIDTEISTIHKFVRDIYATKYQELEQLVADPLSYAQVVRIIGNETDITLVEGDLLGIVPQTTILTISVTATTTIGKPLPQGDLQKVLDGCDAIIKLNDAKERIFDYIESRMGLTAPNLSAVVGSDIAARLVGIAGGLKELAKIPSCNLHVLGAKKTRGLGLAKTRVPRSGLLSACVMMHSCPLHLRHRLIRVLSGKVTLAARIDCYQEDTTGETGLRFLDEIYAKVTKWQEPPPPKKKKALAAPLGEYKKKRGGKKARREKDKLKMTEVQKQKNRIPFGKAQITDDYTGESFGMLGLPGTGRLSIRKKDKQKLKHHLSRKTQARLRRVRARKGVQSGTTSNIAMTPVQGMELVAPLAARLDRKSSGKYFSENTGFLKVGGGRASSAKSLTMGPENNKLGQ